MRLYIKQKGHIYRFFKNDEKEEVFTGFWDRKRKIGLFAKVLSKENEELVTVNLFKEASIWNYNKTEYKILLHKENTEIIIKALNAWKGHWTFMYASDSYEFYFHRGHKKSLFRNGNQVAKFDKGRVNFWDYDSGFIVANNDENKLLLLALFLCFDMGESMDGDVNVDLGNLLAGVKQYDSTWFPK
ncbi:hypothetical protein [Rufibacter aurantiacus]|uniref:hypothetical protein n=1 Tax=Rufibacter aurantiacus TaxID=2817374 RepID=UPI001B30AD2C|nr:hypothetical protein [Rufibacter aurantiacus]